MFCPLTWKTDALAAVRTGEDVLREGPLPGAVLTRVASSHIRVGTFQVFAARNDMQALRQLYGADERVWRAAREADGRGELCWRPAPLPGGVEGWREMAAG